MKAFANPLLLVVCVLALVCGAASAPGEEGMSCEDWVLYACLMAVIVNGALGLARALSHRPSLQNIGWAVVFLLFGSSVWALNSGREETLCSAEGRMLRERVTAWHEGRVSPWAQDEHGESLPLLAAGLGERKLLEELLSDATGVASHPALLQLAAQRAAERNREQALLQLLSAGVSPDACVHGHYLLHSAASNRARRAASCLLEAGASVHVATEDGLTPLHQAVLADDAEMVRLLLQHGANPEQADADGREAASYARSEAVSEALARPPATLVP